MKDETKQNLMAALKMTLTIMAFLVGVHLLSYILPLRHLGILPRSVAGLVGILAAPFIHGTWGHLIGNLASFFLLGIIFFTMERRYPLIIMMHFIILGGFGTWLIGRNSNHIGASIVIFGMIGYLVFTGIFKKELKAILVSIFVILFYGSAITGLISGVFRFDVSASVSIEGHICGFISGIVTAWFYGRKELFDRSV